MEDEDDLEIAAPIAAVVKPEEPKPAKLEPKPAAPRVERAVSARPAAPDESSGSGMLIAIILLICAVGAGYWWWSNQEQEGVVVEETEEVVEEVVAAATTIESNVVAEILIDGEARGTTPLDISLPVGTEVIITARAAGEEQSRPVMVPESFEGPIRFEFEEAALPWVVTITTTPAGAQLTVDGEAAQNELTLEEAPERMEIMATHPGHRSATATVTAGDFTLSDGAMVYAVALTLQPRAERIEGPTAMTTMTAVMEAAPMETEAATMETAMEAATMEVATMEATMEAEAVTMAPATMEPATMEPATMEPVVPDNPF